MINRQGLRLLLSTFSVRYAAAQLTFTAIPGQDESTLLARANAVSAYLENYIQNTCGVNVTVTYNPVTNYEDAVDALLDTVADFGWYGGLTGVQAGLRSPPAVYIAQRVEDKQFTSVFIQGEGMNITNGVEGAEGKSLAYGSASSTSGHLMPAYYLGEADVTPASTIFTGSHDLTVDAVINGTTEVGALNSVVWKNRVAANTTGGTSVYYTTPDFVDYLWVAGSGIVDKWAAIEGASSAAGCENVDTLLTEAFVSADAADPLAQALFNAYSTVGFVAITAGEYDPIEETGCSLGMIEEKYCTEPIPADLGNVGNSTSPVPATVNPNPIEPAPAPGPAPPAGLAAPTAQPVAKEPSDDDISSGSVKCLSVYFTAACAIAFNFV